jgi:DNA replication and repair protein RecF
MKLESINLQAFRSYTSQQFEFDQQTAVIVGPNAIGKTSIIEAIDLLARGSSFRATKIEEMIRFGAEVARVTGQVVPMVGSDDGQLSLKDVKAVDADEGEVEEVELEVLLTTGLVQGKRTQKRLFSVNGVRRRRRDFLGKLYTVVFRPEDMRLVEGSPSRRRTYLDTPLTMLNQRYDAALTTYDKALRQTNKLLEQIRDRRAPLNSLTFWNATLLKHGQYVQEQRRQLTSFINTVDFPLPFSLKYQPSIISEARLQEYQSRALAAGHMLIGPHKDDFVVSLQTSIANAPELFDIAAFGSRGQQRMAVLWLKIAEQAFVKHQTQQQPLLLLDDILSELDPEVRAKVLQLLPYGQAIITSADATILPEIKQVMPTFQLIEL